MRKMLLLLFGFFSLEVTAQNNYKVTMNGIGDFKIGMKKSEVEKLLNQTLTLKNLSGKEEGIRDTLPIKYKDLELSLIMDKQFIDEHTSSIILWGVVSNSALVKTLSDITIGDDKLKIIGTYDNYTIHISPDYENNNTVKSKTKSTIWLFDDTSGNQIVFHLENNKVYSMGVSFIEEYD